MRVCTRARPFVFICLLVMLFSLCLCNLDIHTVQAKKNDKITELIMVGNRNVEEMRKAVETQYLHNGDVSQHKWVYKTFADIGTVESLISDVEEEAKKQAVVIWMGEEYLDDKQVFMCADGKPTEGNAVDADGDGKPTDKIDDNEPVEAPNGTVVEAGVAKYNATSLGRALNGYNYDVEYWVPEFDEYHNQIGQHLETKTEHAQGYRELWMAKGAKVYVASLGPVSKAAGDGGNGKLDVVGDVPENVKTNCFNKSFSSEVGDMIYLDIYDMILDHNPYYRDGTKGGENSSYDDHTLQFIFHLLWNTVLLDNPMDEPPEPIDVSFYSISASLTTYMNTILSSNADEDHADHKLIEATSGMADAGAFIGYGDKKDFEFKSYITGVLSKTSSVMDYGSLIELEDDSENNLYYYSRYGRLLNDMGFDTTSADTSGIGARAIPGAFVTMFYVLSAGMNFGFSEMMNLLRLFNPFQFFANTDAIAPSLQSEMSSGGFTQVLNIGNNLVTYIGKLYKLFQKMGILVVLPLVFSLIIIRVLLSRNYTDASFRAKEEHRSEDFSIVGLFYKYFMRVLFITAGVPLLGCMYTAALDTMCEVVSTADCASTEIVASTFVNFGEWAKQYRLSPVPAGTFISEEAGGNSKAGQADDATYQNLRSTAFAINKATGVTEHVDMSEFGAGSLKDVKKWNQNALQVTDGSSWNASWETATHKYQRDTESMKEALSLLITWTRGSFYHASDWESDTMSAFTNEHKDLVGRRPGLDEENPPSNENLLYELFENTTTVDSWTSRSSEENLKIFSGEPITDAGKFDWGAFNIFSNGTMTANKTGGNLKFTDSSWLMDSCGTSSGLCPGSDVGLSTMSLYNYLSSDFQTNQVVMYSQKEAASTYTSKSHYTVNLVGRGSYNLMYYLSMLMVMLVVSILGIYYACGMVWDNVKRSLSLLTAIPGAMLGVLRSVVNVIVIVITMIFEVFATVVLYEVLSDFLCLLLTITEDPLTEAGVTVTALPGLLAKIGTQSGLNLGKSGILLHLVLFSALCLGLVVILVKYAKVVRFVVNIVAEMALRWLIPYESVWAGYDVVKKHNTFTFFDFKTSLSLVIFDAN